jgi:alanine transaminase
MDPKVQEQLVKAWSVNLCPNVNGQIAMACQMLPPKEGEPSYELYCSEREAVFSSLKRRALAVNEALNKLEGVSCQAAEGAMYCFPTLQLPQAAVEAAAAKGQAADFMYCMECLESTGIVIVPGSGFRQREGTWHFRTTFLPTEADIGTVIESLSAFHGKFMDKYRC